MNNKEWDAMLRRKAEREDFTVNQEVEARIRRVIENPETAQMARKSSRRGLTLGLAAAVLLCAAALAVGRPQKDIVNDEQHALTQPEEAFICMEASQNTPILSPVPTIAKYASASPTPMPMPTLADSLGADGSLSGLKNEVVSSLDGVPGWIEETSLSAHYAACRLDLEATVRNASDTDIAYAVWQPIIDGFLLDARQVNLSETECLLLPHESFTFRASYNLSVEALPPDSIVVGHRLKDYHVTATADQIVRLSSLAAPKDEDYAAEQAELLKRFSEGALLTIGTGQLYLPDGVAEDYHVQSPVDGYQYNIPKLLEMTPTVSIAQWNETYGFFAYFDESAAPLAAARGNGCEWRLMRVSDYKNPYIVIDALFDSEAALHAFEDAWPEAYCSASVDGASLAYLRLGQFCGRNWQDSDGAWHCTGVLMYEDVEGMESGDTLACHATYLDATGKRARIEGSEMTYVLP